jgi:hypothetical protein
MKKVFSEKKSDWLKKTILLLNKMKAIEDKRKSKRLHLIL